MDSTYHQQGQMGPSPFFYYNPDPKPDNRQHGHFSQQPAVQMPMYHAHMQQMPSTPIYSRPNSSCSQPPMPPQMYSQQFHGSLTPMASPRPLYQKSALLMQDPIPNLVVDAEHSEVDMYYYGPSTPPLSASGSVISSPSYDGLATPLGSSFMGFEGVEGVKEGCETDVQSENLAGDWASAGSPPMTPGKFLKINFLSGSKIVQEDR